MKKKLPTLKSDKEAEDFFKNEDLTEYDLSGCRRVRFVSVKGQGRNVPDAGRSFKGNKENSRT